MLTFRTLMLWLHLSAIIVWVGGMVVVPLVVTPAVRRGLGENADELVAGIVRRFQRLSRELILVILLTGIFNVLNVGLLTGFSYPASFLQMVGAKVALFVAMVANQAWFSYVLVPKRLDRKATWSAVVNIVLAFATVGLGLALGTG